MTDHTANEPASASRGESTRFMTLRAAGGDPSAHAAFAKRFLPEARRLLAARWTGGPFEQEVDDAVQEVFVEVLRPRGALRRVDRDHEGSIRSYFATVVRHVALRIEKGRVSRYREQRVGEFGSGLYPDLREEPVRSLERAWAEHLLAEAWRELARGAGDRGGSRPDRVQLLRWRYESGRSMRELASVSGAATDTIYAELRQARRNFSASLRAVVARLEPESGDRLEERCKELLVALE